MRGGGGGGGWEGVCGETWYFLTHTHTHKHAPATLSARLFSALSSLGFACHFSLPCPFWGFVKNKLKRTDATEAFGMRSTNGLVVLHGDVQMDSSIQ